MALIVQKYGGSSLSSPEKINKVAGKITQNRKRGEKVVAVVSAMGDTTNKLLKLASQVSSHFSKRELDLLLSSGEIISSALLSMALQSLGERAIAFNGSQGGIITDEVHTKARIQRIEVKRILDEVKKGKVVVVAGFQGVTSGNVVTTLGRGGSDLTAVALAAGLKAKLCEVYTDVEGVYTADPRIVPGARKLRCISYEEMLELASAGAKIIHPRAVEMAQKYKVRLHIRSSFTEKEGTLVE